MNKHTPGPWLWSASPTSGEKSLLGSNGAAVIEASAYEGMSFGFAGDETYATQNANARLIAAAPELYEALRGIVADADLYDDEGHLQVVHPDSVAKARAALAKVDA